ncbi:hypothetical protein TNIN_495551 [Trichonephila inaurata madagascariensis]|uniref:Uncharacterized protein n=1 Tax=Trichonephila inaurata madagascariensis TaxID=2747483 RepID=A0A8X7BVG3_9ARAC|nr:hypothetical protein TNIN_495551 [Trichonephila inaurata madagascariensis]
MQDVEATRTPEAHHLDEISSDGIGCLLGAEMARYCLSSARLSTEPFKIATALSHRTLEECVESLERSIARDQ